MASKRKSAKTRKKTSSSRGKSSSEPATMEGLLAKYGSNIRALKTGDRLKGKVTQITKKRVFVDIGGKSEGIVAEKAYKEAEKYIRSVSAGDEIQVKVIAPETPEGYALLSLREAAGNAFWRTLEEALKKKTPMAVVGKNVNPAGVVVDIGGKSGFIPKSQLGKNIVRKPGELVGKYFKALVIDLDRDNNKIVLSEREISDKEDIEFGSKALAKIKEGDVFDGKVSAIAHFGCFVAIELPVNKKKVKIEGLVHISELSWDKVNRTEGVVKIGEKVKVKVIGKRNNKLALSIKKTQADPWESVSKKYKKDKKVKGKVTRVADFGVFVQLEPGIEGLVHLTKIPPGKKFSVGDTVNVFVEEVDKSSRKVSLGLILTTKPLGYK